MPPCQRLHSARAFETNQQQRKPEHWLHCEFLPFKPVLTLIIFSVVVITTGGRQRGYKERHRLSSKLFEGESLLAGDLSLGVFRRRETALSCANHNLFSSFLSVDGQLRLRKCTHGLRVKDLPLLE